MEDEHLPTMQELAATAAGERGLVCRKCGCRDFRVYYTRQRRLSVFRVRICRHCGAKISTTESEV